ncbi:hypothetical protein MKW98_001712 [Papaver atlanticum]|uniref:MIF4G domain-containing protein n=1 Tax=Papaver atlanticum TaxID=357466 RepID=A0AAD4S6A8_9MAGN|nr:hypothetical protein MKW98_001712 [Papaver atlanticum]
MEDTNSISNEEVGPVPPPPCLSKAELPWMRTMGKENLSSEECVLRKVRGVLNKLTVEKYKLLRSQLIHSGITTPYLLRQVASLIFNRAVMEPTLCPLYAFLCFELCQYLPSFPPDEPGGKEVRFMRILMKYCQEAFEGENMMAAEIKQQILTGASNQDLECRYKERRRNLGNIQFICELSKQKRVFLRIVHFMLKHLVEQNDGAVNVEAVCLLLNTVGKQLDEFSNESRFVNDTYFVRLEEMLNTHTLLETRLKYVIRDVLDLRSNNWVHPRHKVKDKTISELIRCSAAEVLARLRLAGSTTTSTRILVQDESAP